MALVDTGLIRHSLKSYNSRFSLRCHMPKAIWPENFVCPSWHHRVRRIDRLHKLAI